MPREGETMFPGQRGGDRPEQVGERPEQVGDRPEQVGDRPEQVGERLEQTVERLEQIAGQEGNALTRREFVQTAAAGTAALSLGALAGGCSAAAPMPTRPLGRTGLEISRLAFGGGSQFLLNEDGVWEPLLERAVEAGVNWFDTCSSYQWGASLSSEERFGEILPRHRSRIHIVTKFESRDPEEMKREVEQSLTRLKTDYVDVLMIHSIEPSEDIAAVEAGVWREMVRLKEGGAARFLGFSSMNSAGKSAAMLTAFDIDVALLAMNPTGYGAFPTVALPAARSRGTGVIAMKVMRDIVGEETGPEELLRWAWTRDGVASAVVGHASPGVFETNLATTLAAGDAPEEGSDAMQVANRGLEERLAPLAGPHALCWARPGYRDNGVPC